MRFSRAGLAAASMALLLAGGFSRTRFSHMDSTRPEPLPGEGVLTAYFAPEYEARSTSSREFSAPVRPKPSDLVTVDAGVLDPAQAGRQGAARKVGGKLSAYPDRAEIEARPKDEALAWMRPEELFFLQIQGSGVLTFEGGRRMKALFAATNGRPFLGQAFFLLSLFRHRQSHA